MIQDELVYHGSDSHNDLATRNTLFFSSSQTFAKDYGEVKEYSITINQPFHTGEEADINQLLQQVKIVRDAYSEEEFHSFQELEDSGLLYHDTWEIFEPFMNEIELLGYDGMVIFEGGIMNYVVFELSNIKEVSPC